MTWYYHISEDGSEIDIYEDDPEFSGLVETVTLNPAARESDLAEVKKVMRATWEANADLGSSPVMNARAGHILMDMLTEDIEKGELP